MITSFLFKKSSPNDMFIDFRESRRERERREREILIGFLPYLSRQDQTHDLGRCPDWGWNPQRFGVGADAPAT